MENAFFHFRQNPSELLDQKLLDLAQMKVRIIGTLVIVLSVFYVGEAQSVRIKLVNCNIDKETLTHIQNSLTYQLRFYSQIFNQPIDTSFRAVVFGTEKEFVKYAKSKANYNPLKNHSIAFYHEGLNEMILHKEVENFPKVFAHEVSHAILSFYCNYETKWLDEGLAEVLEDVVANDSVYYFADTQHSKITTVQKLFLEGRSIKEPLNTTNFNQPPSNIRNYNLSFAIVLYFFQTRKEILKNIMRSDCSQVNNIININYPEGLDLLQIDVKSWFLNYDPRSN